MNDKHKKRIGLLALLIAVAFMGIVTWVVGRPMVRFVSDPEKFRFWVEGHGIWGRLVFLGMMVLQVIVAFIPGEPLEIGAGYAFGAVEGSLLCLGGILLGSLIVFLAVRRFGVKLVEVFFSMDKIRSLKFLQNEKRMNTAAFFIFLLPGTPKDLLSYFVGLTPMKQSTWLLMTSVARIPSVVTSTIGGNALSSENYLTAIIVFAVTAVISIGGWLIYNRWIQRRQNKKEKE